MLSTPRAVRSMLASLPMLLLAGWASAQSSYTIEAIVYRGDPAPTPPGGVFEDPYVRGHSASNTLAVPFQAANDFGTPSGTGIFVNEAGVNRAVALDTHPATGSNGGAFWQPSSPSISPNGIVVFETTVAGSPDFVDVIYVDDGGVLSPGPSDSDTAPGTGGGTYRFFITNAVNSAGDLVFRAPVLNSTNGVTSGIFARESGVDRLIAHGAQTAPGTGGTYGTLRGSDILDNGDILFNADLSVTGKGVFLDSGGVVRAVAIPGDPAPGTIPFLNATYVDAEDPTIAANGDIAFRASLSEYPYAGLFVDSNGVDSEIALVGDEAPGTTGGVYSYLHRPAIGDNGDVAFIASISGGSESFGIFASTGAAILPVIFGGDVLPGTGGGTFQGTISSWMRMDDTGAIIFDAYVDVGGPTTRGVFRAIPPPPFVPTMSAVGLGIVVMAVAVVGVKTRRSS